MQHQRGYLDKSALIEASGLFFTHALYLCHCRDWKAGLGHTQTAFVKKSQNDWSCCQCPR